ncbi:MAG: RNA polymerase factor sigma-54 [Magnetovibrionaceae bacterium]
MALNPRLDLRQTQQLVMTPQLQQAIKLLQFSHFELSAFVEQELEQNPLLERAEGPAYSAGEAEAAPGDAPPDGGGSEGGDGDGGVSSLDATVSDGSTLSGDKALDMDNDVSWGGEQGPGDMPEAGSSEQSVAIDGAGGGEGSLSNWGSLGSGGGGYNGEGDEFGLEQTVSGEVTLAEHLTEQLNLAIHDPGDRMIGVHLIDMLDAAGYVTGPLEDLAARLGCPLERVEAVLDTCQGFDPAGVFARSLAECLALQLKDRNRYDPAIGALLDNLDLLAKRDLGQLVRVCGVDEEDVRDMVAEIRALDPKPALAFDHEVSQPIVPDVLMRAKPDGSWHIELNPDTLPRVLVNNSYHAQVVGRISGNGEDKAARAKGREERQYINECFQSANWLVKSLHQRATTILKVASEIVAQQDGFFSHGVGHLRPLVLRDIAEAIEMHESTVSRVTSNKYISTPRGIFELKYFFTTAIGSTDGGDAFSAESVRHRIKALIDDEDPKKVLSDDKIVDILKTEGMDIARRTVAKYREALGIPSSVQRRRQKTSAL